jgi:hypothetical protein
MRLGVRQAVYGTEGREFESLRALTKVAKALAKLSQREHFMGDNDWRSSGRTLYAMPRHGPHERQ